MQRVISLSLPFNKSLVNTILLYNDICNLHIQKSLELRSLSKSLLHQSLYKYIRDKYPSFSSALIQCARDNAVEILRSNKSQPHTLKKKYSSIRFDLRTCKVFLESGQLSITTIDGRKKFNLDIPSYFSKYFSWKVKGLTLGYKKGHFLLKVIVEGDRVSPVDNNAVLGIDLGLKNFAVMSNGFFVKSNKLRTIKRKYSYLRRRLQSCGTRSARRKLKRLSERERRFMQDFNHSLSKQVVELDYRCFALEDLKGIRKGRKGKRFNRMRSNWAYYQFRQFLSYKAEDRGKEIILVEPYYTSQQCSSCSYIAKENRNKGQFSCKNCSFSISADLNASINISRKGQNLFEQAVVNQPIVTINERQRIRSRY